MMTPISSATALPFTVRQWRTAPAPAPTTVTFSASPFSTSVRIEDSHDSLHLLPRRERIEAHPAAFVTPVAAQDAEEAEAEAEEEEEEEEEEDEEEEDAVAEAGPVL